MAWPTNSLTDEARVKWNTAMKFLIPAKFDVTRAIELYRTHEVSHSIDEDDSIGFLCVLGSS
jgi:hypothetical protein